LKFSCQENFEDLWELANGHPDGVCNSPRKVADCFFFVTDAIRESKQWL